jgi:hypothetical protein
MNGSQHAQRAIGLSKNAVCAFEKFEPGHGRVRPPVGALEQRRAEAVLYMLKPPAEGRLPDLEGLGGLPQAPML